MLIRLASLAMAVLALSSTQSPCSPLGESRGSSFLRPLRVRSTSKFGPLFALPDSGIITLIGMASFCFSSHFFFQIWRGLLVAEPKAQKNSESVSTGVTPVEVPVAEESLARRTTGDSPSVDSALTSSGEPRQRRKDAI